MISIIVCWDLHWGPPFMETTLWRRDCRSGLYVNPDNTVVSSIFQGVRFKELSGMWKNFMVRV